MFGSVTRLTTALHAKSPLRTVVRSADELLQAARRSGADIVSVDLFDTLVYRRVFEPNDAFYVQYGRVASIPGVGSASNWLRLRKETEERLSAAAWPSEITLASIYEDIALQLGLDAAFAKALLATELEVENDLIRPYEDLVAALRSLRQGGTTIVVLTDTYLPGDFIRALLERFLDFEFTLLCSCVTGKTKRAGQAFQNLRATFAGRKILHFGDNVRSDIVMAMRNGESALQVCWHRQARLEAGDVRHYADALGATRVITPWDSVTAPVAGTAAMDDVAWRWSFVLADFLLSLRRYACAIKATDIWFLSRDGETMFASLSDVPDFMAGFRCQYVPASRACIYPLVAKADPALFEKWRKRKATEQDERDGELAHHYYRGLIQPDTSRVLIVDNGWKGRLQVLLGEAMPPGVDVFGYYFALEPSAEPAAIARSDTFVEWRESLLNEALVEALSGFEAPSALGFERTGKGIQPRFTSAPGDRAPTEYCARLRVHLSALLSGYVASVDDASPDVETRIATVRRMSLYPDLDLMDAFQSWSIGTVIDGSDAGNIASGGRASAINKLIGRGVDGNVWPAAAVWTLTRRPLIGRLIQHAIRWRLDAKRLLAAKRPAATKQSAADAGAVKQRVA